MMILSVNLSVSMLNISIINRENVKFVFKKQLSIWCGNLFCLCWTPDWSHDAPIILLCYKPKKPTDTETGIKKISNALYLLKRSRQYMMQKRIEIIIIIELPCLLVYVCVCVCVCVYFFRRSSRFYFIFPFAVQNLL